MGAEEVAAFLSHLAIAQYVSARTQNQALRDPLAVTIEDSDAAGEIRFVTLGMDVLGRVLVVVDTPQGEDVRLVSARRASRGDAAHYHAQKL